MSIERRHDGVDQSGSIFGRVDRAEIARGFGLRGATVNDASRFRPLFDAYRDQELAEVSRAQGFVSCAGFR